MFLRYENKHRREEKHLETRLQRERMYILEGKILVVLNYLLSIIINYLF